MIKNIINNLKNSTSNRFNFIDMILTGILAIFFTNFVREHNWVNAVCLLIIVGLIALKNWLTISVKFPKFGGLDVEEKKIVPSKYIAITGDGKILTYDEPGDCFVYETLEITLLEGEYEKNN